MMFLLIVFSLADEVRTDGQAAAFHELLMTAV
jgi:hypothetical protein